MTAVFGTPVAAVLLAVELLLFEWRPRSFLPVALACAVAGFARVAFFGTGPLFPLVTAPPGALSLVSCVIAGLLSGALASGLVGRALQDRRPVRQAADPLDVVARDRRTRRRHRRISRAARARRRLRRDRRPAAPAHRDADRRRDPGREGGHLGRRARLGHLGRRARAAADAGRGTRHRARARCCRAANRRCGRSSAWRPRSARRWARR